MADATVPTLSQCDPAATPPTMIFTADSRRFLRKKKKKKLYFLEEFLTTQEYPVYATHSYIKYSSAVRAVIS